MENDSNSVDLTALLEELEDTNQGIDAQNEKLDELIEYLIAKDKQEAKEKQEAKQAQEAKEAQDKADQLAADQAKKQQDEEAQKEADEQSAREAQEAQAKAESDGLQAETYQELLMDIRDQQDFGNQISAVNGVYIGIVIGLLFIKIFVDRLRRL